MSISRNPPIEEVLWGFIRENADVESINLEKRKRALKAANAVSKVEGASSSNQAEQIFRQWAEGKLTNKQMKAKIFAPHNNANI